MPHESYVPGRAADQWRAAVAPDRRARHPRRPSQVVVGGRGDARMTVPPRQSDDVRIPEDVIERAARGWDPDFESYTSMLRAEALEDASRALVASGLPARVAELEELCDQLAFVVNSYDEASSDVYKAELRAEVIEAARLLAAALNAKGAE